MNDMDTAHVDQGEYRQYLPNLSTARFTKMQQQDYRAYADEFKRDGNPLWLHGLYLHWRTLFKEPFRGITTDGVVIPVD